MRRMCRMKRSSEISVAREARSHRGFRLYVLGFGRSGARRNSARRPSAPKRRPLRTWLFQRSHGPKL
eukprot:1017501-Prorocentrum_minimum.AAC.4